uniref:Putative Ku70 n=1 Tax=Schmidtea mediterranea TaxID=79327 RepID=A0A109PR91_SCHMD|nr:putative Ku70 [Schmidtea mediterranea]
MEWTYNFEIDDNEDIEAEFKEDNLPRGIIFLIDCVKLLFEETVSVSENENKTWFEAIINGILSVVKNKAMTSNKDNVSIKSNQDVIMKNVLVFQELDTPNLTDVQKLMELQSITKDAFDSKYGFAEECSLYHALWCCQRLFMTRKSKLANKQIVFFTNDDDPCNNQGDIQKSLLVKFRDVKQNNIKIEIIPIGDENNFTVDKFYKMILVSETGDSLDNCVEISKTSSRFDELMTRIRHKQYPKRVTNRIPWFLGSESLSIGVSLYNLVKKTPSLAYVPLDRRTNTEVHKKRTQVLKESGQLLMPFDMKYGIKIHGKYICFEKEEINKMRSIVGIGIHLIGFKPLKYLKSYYQIRSAQFLYPDDSSIEGSTNLFAALLKRCYERNLFALCAYVPRKSSRLQLVGLVPQMEKYSDVKIQIRPPGFSVIFLPFADDIRKLDLPLSNEVSDQDREMGEELIKSLFVGYEPETILNPALQKQLTYLEAIALDLEIPDKIEDNTVLNNDEINEHCGNVLEAYKDYFELGFQTSIAKFSSKPKVDIDIEVLYKSNRLDSATVAQLKDEANKLKIKIKGSKKADIIKCISDHFISIN